MAHTSKPDLVLRVACEDDSPRTWALGPQGRDTFRIVIRCEDTPGAASRHSSRFFRAIAHGLLSSFALWRT